MRSMFVFVLSLVLGTPSPAQIVKAGRGSYTDQLTCDPSVPKEKWRTFGPGEDGQYYWAHGGGEWRATKPAVPKVSAKLARRPIPTNDWWSSLVWRRPAAGADAPYSMPMHAYPLSFKAAAEGMKIASQHTERTKPAGIVHTGFNSELTVGLTGMSAPETRVHAFTDLTVTTDWNQGELRATFGRGLPFAWFTRSSRADARVQLDGPGAQILSNSKGVLLAKVDGRYYGLFGPAASRWMVSGAVITSSLAGKAHFSIGLLPSTSDEQALRDLPFFRGRAYAEPTAATVTYRYDEQKSTLITHFALRTKTWEKGHGEVDHTVFAMLPHHYLNTTAKLTDYSYDCVRGPMKVLDANAFQVQYNYHGVLPDLPLVATEDSGYSKSRLEALLKQTEGWRGDKLETTGETVLNPGSYWFGKHMNQMAQAILIADQVGDLNLRDQHLGELKCLLEDWFTATPEERTRLQKNEPGSKLLHYDKTWGSLIAYPSEFGTDCNLNDHHFHYGYWLMAAATIARFDPEWASSQNFGEMVGLLIRDVASPDPKDPMFPRLRHFDPYAGHCWAGGFTSDAQGNNQESTSESLNFSAALVQWGEATGNKSLRDLGVYLYTTEVAATEEYWFDQHNLVFDRLHYAGPVVGIVFGDGQEYRLWWTGTPEAVLGIQVVPVTGASLYLGHDLERVRKQYEYVANHRWQDRNMPPDLMQDLVWSYLALADPAKAIALYEAAGPDYTVENGGEFRAHTYHWLHNLAALGTVDWSVTADIPTYAVFQRKGAKIHVAYNAGGKVRTVHFSDGVILEVPPRKMVVR